MKRININKFKRMSFRAESFKDAVEESVLNRFLHFIREKRITVEMTKSQIIVTIFLFVLVTSVSYAKVDLVTLPDRDTVQLTIYNSADMTLARESRSLTLKSGTNELQFSWENTLIDPTSLDMVPKAHVGDIDIANLTFPPRVRNLGLWSIESDYSGKVPIEIEYLTSGLSWRAFYMGTLTEKEDKMRLQGYVRVTNNSGEDYENAQVRLIVGQVHMIDEISALAQSQYPYGRPGQVVRGMLKESLVSRSDLYLPPGIEEPAVYATGRDLRSAEIVKEGLSEYFLYTIDGEQTIENGWSKRMISFDTEDIPVVNLYKYEEERYGNSVIRFLSFTNDEEHELGDTPIPGGMLKVYRNVDEEEHLSYEGQSDFKYIPVNEEVELNLGSVANIVVEPKLMDFRTDNYRFDSDNDIIGWDEFRTYEIEVRNTRDVPVEVEIKRNFPTQFWNVTDNEDFENYDSDTIKFSLEMEPVSKQTITYTLQTFNGTRQDDAPVR